MPGLTGLRKSSEVGKVRQEMVWRLIKVLGMMRS